MDLPDSIRPRVIVTTPLGVTVLDPLAPGPPMALPPGFSYEVVVGDPGVDPAAQTSLGAQLGLVAALVIGGSVWLGWSLHTRRK